MLNIMELVGIKQRFARLAKSLVIRGSDRWT